MELQFDASNISLPFYQKLLSNESITKDDYYCQHLLITAVDPKLLSCDPLIKSTCVPLIPRLRVHVHEF